MKQTLLLFGFMLFTTMCKSQTIIFDQSGPDTTAGGTTGMISFGMNQNAQEAIWIGDDFKITQQDTLSAIEVGLTYGDTLTYQNKFMNLYFYIFEDSNGKPKTKPTINNASGSLLYFTTSAYNDPHLSYTTINNGITSIRINVQNSNFVIMPNKKYWFALTIRMNIPNYNPNELFGVVNAMGIMGSEFDACMYAPNMGLGSNNWQTFYDAYQIQFMDNLNFKLYKPAPSIISSTTNTFKGKSIQVYPNPVQDYIELSTTQSLDQLTAKLISPEGKVLKANIDKNRIDVSKLSGGVYILQITHKNDIIHSQLIHKH